MKNTPAILRAERMAIAFFCARNLEEDMEDGFVYVDTLWKRYSKETGSTISLDSFGRLLPKFYNRQILSHPGQRTRRAIIGYVL